MLTLTLVGIVEAGGFTFSGPALEFTKELVLGTLIGVVAGAVLCYAVASTARAGIWDESPGVAILAVVALAYFSTESLGGSAYLATFVMGLMVGNMEMLGLGHHDEHATLLEGFLGQVAEIATLLVFVTLGINLPFEALGQYFFGGLLVMFVFIFVARPITVLACLLPDRRGGWTGREIAFISWCRETGVDPRRRCKPAPRARRRRRGDRRLHGRPRGLRDSPPASDDSRPRRPPSRPVRFLARRRHAKNLSISARYALRASLVSISACQQVGGDNGSRP